MRGKGQTGKPCTLRARITPAHAGKRWAYPCGRRPCRDHPRTCGEKDLNPIPPALVSGSPPHMRGKVGQLPEIVVVIGITPAHAGKSIPAGKHPGSRWDHPRTCGEKLRITRLDAFLEGSPPHMRGKVFLLPLFQTIHGITPAHAGKSNFFLAFSLLLWDHPRTCGEKSGNLSSTLTHSGSPPHMRGKEWSECHQESRPGITPAHAGKRLRKP